MTSRFAGSICRRCFERLLRMLSRMRSLSSGVIVCSLAYMWVTFVCFKPFVNFAQVLWEMLYVSPMLTHQILHLGDCRILRRCIICSSFMALLKFCAVQK